MVEEQVSKLDFPLNEESVAYALEKMEQLYQSYLNKSRQNIYVSIVPDKNYYIARQHGYPAMDYETLFRTVKQKTPYAQYIDITKTLSKDSYYNTDTHWRQETLSETVNEIRKAMGHTKKAEPVEIRKATNQFYGVYEGQSAYIVKPEELNYCTNELLQKCKVDIKRILTNCD